MSDSTSDAPHFGIPALLSANKAPKVELYAMECTLTVRSIETLGNSTTEREAELVGYLSKEVLETALDTIKEVLA